MVERLSADDYESLSKGSGLDDGTIKQRGYWTATKVKELSALGFAPAQCLVPALVIPVHTVDGGNTPKTLYQIRPASPRLIDGKPVKYETVAGQGMRIDVPPQVYPVLGDPREPLYITEGAKKADAAAQRLLACIALLGVWNWRGRGIDGGVLELSDWDAIALKGRQIFICFDSDVMTKPQVRGSLIRLAAMLRRRGASSVSAIVLPEPAGKKMGLDDFFVQGGRVAELDEHIDDSLFGGVIEVIGRGLVELTSKALDSISANDDGSPKIYQRSGELVRVVSDERGAPIIDTLNINSLRGIAAESAEWRKAGKVVFPDRDVIANLLSSRDWPGVNGIFTTSLCPVLTPSGRISTINGYDEEAKVFVKCDAEIPVFDGNAADAASWIFGEVLSDFPFDGEADRAHALALMLLPMVRPFIKGPTPLHLFDAPVQGSGKSLAAKTCLIPTQGQDPAVTSGTKDEEEWRKKIATNLRSGMPYVFFDNLTRKVDSDTLALCLTGTWWNDRNLGSMNLISAPIRCAWVATANNAELSRDILRRTAWVRLDPKMERPEDRRSYKHQDITRWTWENRGLILSAMLRMISDWAEVHEPDGRKVIQYQGRKLGTFEEWSSVIGSILDVAKVPGFLGNIDELRLAADAESGSFAEFYDRWWAEYGSSTVKAKELLDIWKADDMLAGMVSPDKGETMQAAKLGRIISQMVGVVRGGKRVVRNGQRAGSVSYRMDLVKVEDITLFSTGYDFNGNKAKTEGEFDDVEI